MFFVFIVGSDFKKAIRNEWLFFFLKEEKGHITMNLISEGNQVNILLGVNEPAE